MANTYTLTDGDNQISMPSGVAVKVTTNESEINFKQLAKLLIDFEQRLDALENP